MEESEASGNVKKVAGDAKNLSNPSAEAHTHNHASPAVKFIVLGSLPGAMNASQTELGERPGKAAVCQKHCKKTLLMHACVHAGSSNSTSRYQVVSYFKRHTM